MSEPGDSPQNLSEIIKVAREGDLAAFERIVLLFERRVFGFVFRHLNTREDAEDVTQEVFLKVFKKIRSYDPAKSFTTWLFTVAINTVYDHLRRKHVRPELLILDDAIGCSGGIETADERDAYTQVENEFDIERALANIKPAYRTVLLLYYRDELSCEEIAVALGIPVGTVKTHLFRARSAAKNALEGVANNFLPRERPATRSGNHSPLPHK